VQGGSPAERQQPPAQDLRSLQDSNNIVLVMKDGRIEKDLRTKTQ
jgi:hypothetical protein